MQLGVIVGNRWIQQVHPVFEAVIVPLDQSLLKKLVSQHRFPLLPLDLHFHNCTGCWHVRTKDSIEVFTSGNSVFSTYILTECDGLVSSVHSC